jgi:hypothetical protein
MFGDGWCLSHLTTYNYLYTSYLKVGFHIEKMNNWFFNKILLFHKFKINIFHDLLWYCHMRIEIIQIVTYNNYDDFQHLNFIYWQKIISLWFNDEIDCKVRYVETLRDNVFIFMGVI